MKATNAPEHEDAQNLKAQRNWFPQDSKYFSSQSING
jgi:hypothetical protein